MSFATLADRVRFEFMEMPDLELSLAQAGRLWSLRTEECRAIVDGLVRDGFLRWTPRRTLVRAGYEPHRFVA